MPGLRTPGLRTLVALVVAAIVTVIGPPVAADDPGPTHADAVKALFEWVNEERAARGLAGLTWDADLAADATAWSGRIAADGALSHDPALWEQASSRGYHQVGENVGYDPDGLDLIAIHVALMDSPKHRANMLQPGFSAVGIGVACNDGGLYLTQKLAGTDDDPAIDPRTPPAGPQVAAGRDLAVAGVCEGGPTGVYHDVPPSHPFIGPIGWASNHGIAGGYRDGSFHPDASVTRGQMAAFLDRTLHLPTTSQDHFVDDDGSIHQEAINRVTAAGIAGGFSDGRFHPDAPVTRAQMAAFLDRALKLEATSSDYFSDDDGSVHEAAINRVAAAGITAGNRPGIYDTTGRVTRGQMAAFLFRAAA